MPSIIVIIIVTVFLVSYIKFKRRYKMQYQFALFMQEKYETDTKDIETSLSFCSALADAQLYKRAYDLYDEILKDNNKKALLSQEQLERVMLNKRFCDAPIFWSSGARDHIHFKYLHHFFLERIGRRRYSFIREEDLLEFNSRLRFNRMR